MVTDLPTGTVTFLFTDIEGSTRLWAEQPDLARSALTRLDTLVESIVARHGGNIVRPRGEGDSRFAVFTRPGDAVAAAGALLQAAHHEQWPTSTPLRMRIGLHTGEAELWRGDYYGAAVNHAARLRAVAYGGQALISQVTYELAQGNLPADIELRDLGMHRLKDLQRPEHIFQIVVPGLRADFPPLGTLDARPTNLPSEPAPFIVREREVNAIRQRLLDPAVDLVTLVGPGGVGKTRLALHVAADLLDDFPDGVWFVDLTPISDAALVPTTIATTLKLNEESSQSLVESLKAYLRDRHVLLVLDNFELVLDAAPVVAALLQAAPGLKVLITSRASLRMSGEHELPVPPLQMPDPQQLPALEQLSQYEAIALFLQRAQAVKPDFMLTEANAPAVAAICHRLDGLPLALELAAARVKLLPPHALLARLERSLTLLTPTTQDVPARHHTLRSTLDWSYHLLNRDEQRLFARLAVFAGGCTLEAVTAVCNADHQLPMDLLDGLQSLLDKSLLRQEERPAVETDVGDDEPRFTMLATIHEYAAAKLRASGEDPRIREQHAAYFLHLAERAAVELTGPQQGRWLLRLEDELDNFRSALAAAGSMGKPEDGLRLAIALWLFWRQRGRWSEGRSWLERALEHDQVVNPGLRAAALYQIGSLACLQHDDARAVEVSSESLNLARALDDRCAIAWSLHNLGVVALHRNDYPPARADLEASLELFRELDDQWGMANVLNSLGEVATVQGDYARSRSLHQAALEALRSLGNTGAAAWPLIDLGRVAILEGDYPRAIALLEESLLVFRSLADSWGIAWSLNHLGWAARLRGNWTRARELIEESLRMFQSLADTWGIATSLQHLGWIAFGVNRSDEARDHSRESLRLFRRLRGREGILNGLELLAAVDAAYGATTEAVRQAAIGLGAVEAARAAIGSPRPPARRGDFEQLLACVRSRLDPATFDAAIATGKAISIDEAIATALNESMD